MDYLQLSGSMFASIQGKACIVSSVCSFLKKQTLEQ